MLVLSEEKRKELFEKKKYYRNHPEESKRSYNKSHAESYESKPFKPNSDILNRK